MHFNDNRIIRAAKSSASGKHYGFALTLAHLCSGLRGMRNQGRHARQNRCRSGTDWVVDRRTARETDAGRGQMSRSSDAHIRDKHQIASRGEASKLDKQDCSHRPVAGYHRAWLRQDDPQGRGYSAFLDPLFFQIVHVEPVIDDAVTRDVSLDVILHVFLELGRQITQTQVTFLVVPGNDLRTRTFLRIFLKPLRDLGVSCAGSDQRTEIAVINLGKIQPALIERAIGMILALPVHKHGAAFVDCTHRQHVARQCRARAAREFFSIPQITRQQFHFFKVLMHICFFPSWLFGLRSYAPVNSTSQPFGVSPAKRRRCAAFSDIRCFDRASQSFPVACYQLFRRRNSSHALSPALSTSRLKLSRYSSTLRDRLDGSKIERIFSITSVSCSERGSKETTPDVKSFDMVRHAIRRPGI